MGKIVAVVSFITMIIGGLASLQQLGLLKIPSLEAEPVQPVVSIDSSVLAISPNLSGPDLTVNYSLADALNVLLDTSDPNFEKIKGGIRDKELDIQLYESKLGFDSYSSYIAYNMTDNNYTYKIIVPVDSTDSTGYTSFANTMMDLNEYFHLQDSPVAESIGEEIDSTYTNYSAKDYNIVLMLKSYKGLQHPDIEISIRRFNKIVI